MVCYFVGAWREKSNGAMAATSVWNKSVTIQRWQRCIPSSPTCYWWKASSLMKRGVASGAPIRATLAKATTAAARQKEITGRGKGLALAGLGVFRENRCPAFDEALQYCSYDYDDTCGPCADHCLSCDGSAACIAKL